MPHWLIKSAAHRVISWLPRSHFWNGILQARVSRSLELTPDRFEHRVDLCRWHLDHLKELRPQGTDGCSVFELGTGWFPIVPAGLFLCGADRICTVDIAPHLRADRIEQALSMICAHADRGTLAKKWPEVRPERLARLKQAAQGARTRPPEQTLEALNICALVGDAQDTGLESGTIDLFVSDAVLEYVPREVLANILREFRRLARPGAVHSHYLNLVDQYAYFDHGITPFNFLKFSRRQWQWLDSPLATNNRLRITDYRQLFAEAGCPVVREENVKGDVNELAKIRLAPEFQRYSREDLLVLRAWIAARSPSADGRP